MDEKSPQYYKAYYAIQELILSISPTLKPPKSTYDDSPLQLMTKALTETIIKIASETDGQI